MASNSSIRIASVDIFRGLVMLVMIFVNDLADVHGLPAWTHHMPANVDAMTYVDMVFPAFLFAIGLSLPLAVRSRLAKHPSLPALWLHIVQRSVSLMVLGLILANGDQANSRLMPGHFTANAWSLLALSGAVLLLILLPQTTPRLWRVVCRASGAFLLVGMLFLFRRATADGVVHWLDFSYWEILGIIGWTYLATSILYVPLRDKPLAPVFWLAVLSAFNMLSAAHLLQFPNLLPLYLWPWSNGAFAVLTMAGVVTSQLILTSEWTVLLRRKMTLSLALGLVLLVAAFLSAPLGISKIRATPTWCLGSAAACVFLFCLLYWVCDVQRRTRWAEFIRPAGANTLLTYLLPDFFAFGVSLAWLPPMWSYGMPGVCRSLIFTAVILAVAYVLTRWRLRLQL